MLDDLSGAAAAVASAAGLHYAEWRALADPHLPRAAALRAGFRLRALFRTAPAAGGAGVYPGISNIFFTALGGLLKGDIQHRLGVAAAPRGVRVRLPPAAAEPPAAKEAAEDIAQIHAAERIPAEGISPGAAAKAGIHARMAKLVVPGPLIFIGKHFVSLVHLFELGFRILISGVQVRMILFGQFAVGLFNFILRGVFGNTHHLVIVPFISQNKSLLPQRASGRPKLSAPSRKC